MKIDTAATFMKNVTRFADTNRDGTLDQKEVDALNKTLNKTELAAIASAVRVLPGRTSLVGLKVGAFENVVNRIAEQAHYADEAGTGKGRDNGFLSMSEAKAMRLQQDTKSAMLSFAKLANSRGEPIFMHADK